MACGKWKSKNTEGTATAHDEHWCDLCKHVKDGVCSNDEWQETCFGGTDCKWEPRDE